MSKRSFLLSLFGFLVLVFAVFLLTAQNKNNNGQNINGADTCHVNKQRLKILITGEVILAGGTFVYLNELWYKNYPRSRFHWFNDNKEWLQMDKVGHAYSAYHIGEAGYGMLKSCGVKEKKSVFYGGTMGLAYLSIIEILDGFSAEWGASHGDIIANVSGASLFISQQLLWKEQRVALKYSYHPTMYAPLRPDVLGKTYSEQFIKDYNGQTYWLSCNLRTFTGRKSNLPPWLAISFGYGANGMLGGYANPPALGLQRYRQFYLSPDIHFKKIRTNKIWLRTLLYSLDLIKCPMPTLEYNDQKQWRFFLLYF